MSLVSRSYTTIEIDSAVWPGVSRAFRRTRPNSTMSPSCSGVKRNSAFAADAQVNGRSGPIPQLQVPGHEVRVEMRQEDVGDPQPVRLGERQVLVDVALGVDDGRDSARFVAHEYRKRGPGS